MELHVSTSGFQVITLDDNETQFNLHVDKHLNVKLAIPYGGIEALRTSCIELEEGASLTILMKNVKPVSYTHLDVYKRQRWGCYTAYFR